jgi:hypothetical protein
MNMPKYSHKNGESKALEGAQDLEVHIQIVMCEYSGSLIRIRI